MSSVKYKQEGLILAIETSGAMGSVALGKGTTLLGATTLSAPRQHAREFLPAVAQLCQSNTVAPMDLDIVAVSGGPGSFTGLRIGITAARMMAMAAKATTVKVNTLEVIAQNALKSPEPPSRLAVVLDAKRSRVFAGAFELKENGYLPISTPAEVDPEAFLSTHVDNDHSCAVMGEGVGYHREAISRSGWPVLPEEINRPRAETVLQLGLAMAGDGQTVDHRALLPTYIRLPEAEEKWNEKHKG